MTKKLAPYSRMIPGPGDVVFLIVLGMLLIGGPHALLNDPGTPWHLRLGREILARQDSAAFRHADLHARARVLGRPVVGI